MVSMMNRCSHDGCFKHPWYGLEGSRKAEFCKQHAADGMVSIMIRCSHDGCFKHPSYGLESSKNVEFCKQHAMEGMVNIHKRVCYQESCSKKPSYGMKGSKKAESCKQHARDGMVDMVRKRCSNEGCTKQPYYGLKGSRKAEFCMQHAKEGMLNMTRFCPHDDCSKNALYGMEGSKEAEFCKAHARDGMVNSRAKIRECYHKTCSKRAYYGLKGSTSMSADFCQQHARNGMEDVVRISCLHNRFMEKAPHGLESSRQAKFHHLHAIDGMVDMNKKCLHRSCTGRSSPDIEGTVTAGLCMQHSKETETNLESEERVYPGHRSEQAQLHSAVKLEFNPQTCNGQGSDVPDGGKKRKSAPSGVHSMITSCPERGAFKMARPSHMTCVSRVSGEGPPRMCGLGMSGEDYIVGVKAEVPLSDASWLASRTVDLSTGERRMS
ncbi:unnamed protein product [Sphacelaria rigidula]